MYEVTEDMLTAFWSGVYMAIWPTFAVVAWSLAARLINTSLD